MSSPRIDEQTIRQVVHQVIAEIGSLSAQRPLSPGTRASGSAGNEFGVFEDVDRAVAAARDAFEQLSRLGLQQRGQIIDLIRGICREQARELGTMEMKETGVGRLGHKIEKLLVLADKVPGVEFLKSDVFSGDRGLTVIEYAPFGVIAAITPVTHSLPTLAGNAISMIASGNTLVANPHPSGKRVAAEGVRRFNQAIRRQFGIDNLVCVIAEPTLETAGQLFQHRDIALICVTGGPAVAKAALAAAKRAIVAGPGNPPVVVDETADLRRAAQSIVTGGSYDNNLLCIGEKEVFVVRSVLDSFLAAMREAGAVELKTAEVEKLTSTAIQRSDSGYDFPAKDFLGQDASVLANAVGRSVPDSTSLLFGVTNEQNPFVAVEQMMPFVPVVPCDDVDQAIELARKYEHGFRHTSIIHSNNVRNMTRMGRVLDTTIFVKNGPCMAGNGIGGEGYFSYSIAGPTGEGVTTPLTFTRQRRCAMIDDLHILGRPQE